MHYEKQSILNACIKEVESWAKNTLLLFMQDQHCDTIADVIGVLYFDERKKNEI